MSKRWIILVLLFLFLFWYLILDLAFGQINDPADIDSLKHWWSVDSLESEDLAGGFEDSVAIIQMKDLGGASTKLTLKRDIGAGCDTVRYKTNVFGSKPAAWFRPDDSQACTAFRVDGPDADLPHFMYQEDHTFAVHMTWSSGLTDNAWFYDFGIISSTTEPGANFARANASASIDYNLFDSTPQPLRIEEKQATTINTDQFYTFIIVVDSTSSQEGRLYIDGQIDSTNAFGAALATSNVNNTWFIFGRRGEAGNFKPFEGFVRNILFYRKALTAQEVSDLHDWLLEGPPQSVPKLDVRRRGWRRSGVSGR